MSKNEIINFDSENDPAKLWEILNASVKTTVETLRRIAAAIRRLEELGEDVGILRQKIGAAMLSIYRKIACNQVLPEVVAEFGGIQKLMKRIASLPIPDQQGMVDGRPIKVMLTGGDHRLVKPIELSGDDIKQVFGPSGLRTDTEQAAYLHDETRKAQFKTSRATNLADVTVDKKAKCLFVGDVKIPLRELMRYVAEIAG